MDEGDKLEVKKSWMGCWRSDMIEKETNDRVTIDRGARMKSQVIRD